MNAQDEKAAVAMLCCYGFDLGGQTAVNVVRTWGRQYDSSWLVPAIIATLDRGRYKAVSIDQVLAGWQRRGQPQLRFSKEFAAMVLSKLGQPVVLWDEVDWPPDFLDGEIERCAQQEQGAAVPVVPREIPRPEPETLSPARPAPIPKLATASLSFPALDEDEDAALDRSLVAGAQRSEMAATVLIASSYPPAPLRKPSSDWRETATPESVPELPEVFTPPTQVSQFYYRLRSMAKSSPQAAR
jgi:hypothetical protein